MLHRLVTLLTPNLGPVSAGERLRASFGACVGILITGIVTQLAFGSIDDLPLLVAPMGASAVLLFAVPSSPLAQPWSILGGNVSAALIGITCRLLLPDPYIAAALAVGLAIGAMFLLRCLHPPGGAVALTAALGGPAIVEAGYQFAFLPVGLNSLLLLAAALAFNNLTGRPYPHPRATPDATPRVMADPRPTERVGFTAADLDAVLQRYDEVIPIDRDDLGAILHAAEIQAYRRRSGDLTCADIMSRDVAAVTTGTALDAAWSILRTRHFKVLPVIDDARRVIGIVTQTDFVAAIAPDAPAASRLVSHMRRAAFARRATVADLMTTPADCASPETTLAELVPLMADARRHHMPVTDAENRLVGIVTQSDLIAALFAGALAGSGVGKAA